MVDREKSPDQSSDFQDLVDNMRRAGSEDQLWANRGKAVQAYARLEQALFRVFAVTAGILDDSRAAIIFFNITSTHARNKMLRKLVMLHYHDAFDTFWKSVLREIRAIDEERNKIVHWCVSTEVRITGDGFAEPEVLMRPHSPPLALPDPAAVIGNEGLLGFREKCNFYSGIIFTFAAVTSGGVYPPIPSDVAEGWLKVFGRQLSYPVPAGTTLPALPSGFGFVPKSPLSPLEGPSPLPADS